MSGLTTRTWAEIRFEDILKQQRIPHRIEEIWTNGSSFIISDFYLPQAKVVFELDGESHRGKENKDKERDQWLLSTYGITTIRFTNSEVYSKTEEVISRFRTVLRLDAPSVPAPRSQLDLPHRKLSLPRRYRRMPRTDFRETSRDIAGRQKA
jgi:very-short-patch-repair endonuclease